MDKRRKQWLKDSGFDALNIAKNNKVLSGKHMLGLLEACKSALDLIESAVGSDLIPASYVKKEVSELRRAIKNASF